MMALIGSDVASTREATLQQVPWRELADEEYRRLLELVGQLTPDEWHAPTDCDDWDVYALVCHLVGSAEASASPTEAARQQRRGQQLLPGADLLDAMNAAQVEQRRVEAPRQLLVQLADASWRSLAAPHRTAWPVRAWRALRPGTDVDVPWLRGSRLVRNLWLHRIDISRATGHPLHLTAEHDAAIVDELVTGWGAAHGEPFTLHLAGPAGGTWSHGTGGPTLELEAVEFARLVSGRGDASGLLATRVAF